jgi:hypothetical protein
MPRTVYKYDETLGKMVEVYNSDRVEVDAPFVQGDTFSTPLKHPVSEKMFDSKSAYLRETKALGLDVIGNDLLSKKPRQVKDKITDAVIMDKIEKAESILNDPIKREWRARENQERYERAKALGLIK